MLEAHLPLLIAFAVAVALVLFIALLSAQLGPKKPSPVKLEAFECGNPPSGDARQRFSVKFYLVAILFLVFDIEAVFIYPWAVTFSDNVRAGSATAVLALLDMVVFVGVVVVGLVYAWRKGALDWSIRG